MVPDSIPEIWFRAILWCLESGASTASRALNRIIVMELSLALANDLTSLSDVLSSEDSIDLAPSLGVLISDLTNSLNIAIPGYLD